MVHFLTLNKYLLGQRIFERQCYLRKIFIFSNYCFLKVQDYVSAVWPCGKFWFVVICLVGWVLMHLTTGQKSKTDFKKAKNKFLRKCFFEGTFYNWFLRLTVITLWWLWTDFNRCVCIDLQTPIYPVYASVSELGLCMQPLFIRALVLGYLRPASAASEVSW